MKSLTSRRGVARAASEHLAALSLAVLDLPGLLSAQTLQHRYSFTSDASDSVGNANGVLMNNASIANNALQLPRNDTSGDVNCAYVALPNGIVSSDTSITVECWLTDTAGSTWAKAWCFGDSAAGAGNPHNNGAYFSP